MPYCYNCFREYAAGSGPCPHCGYDPPKDQGKYPFALPLGSILAGQFITGRVLGQGGFGITYLALDNRLKSRVAIKEFLPDSMAVRTAGTPQITVYTGQREENFRYGMERFLDEAKVLAKFQGNPHIVGVRSYFEENGTAYFVMDYIEGESFKAYIQDHGGRIPWKEALRILMPVMDALGAVHTEGIIHRDVTPDNIFVTGGGGVKLLDFGSARYSLGDKSRSLDVVLKAGYAPKEQYTRRGRQGPYTDVYSLAACFYSAITGYLPPESLDRADEDDLVLPSTRGIEIPQAVEDVILKGLEVQPADRWQSMGEFRSAMSEAAAEPGEEPEAVPVESAPPEPETDSLSDIQSAPAAEKPRFPEDAGGGAPVGKAEAAGQESATVSGPKPPPSRRVKYGVPAACIAVALIVALAGTFRSPPVSPQVPAGQDQGMAGQTAQAPEDSGAEDETEAEPEPALNSEQIPETDEEPISESVTPNRNSEPATEPAKEPTSKSVDVISESKSGEPEQKEDTTAKTDTKISSTQSQDSSGYVINEPFSCTVSDLRLEGLYTGDWKNGNPDGFGTLANEYHQSYTGGWKKGCPDGQGTYKENGCVYTGVFVDGNLPEGRADYQNGSYYEGEFGRIFDLTGTGKRYNAKTSITCVGVWQNNFFTRGTVYRADGSKYLEGYFLSNNFEVGPPEPNGHCIEYDASGNIVYDGNWTSGKWNFGIFYENGIGWEVRDGVQTGRQIESSNSGDN